MGVALETVNQVVFDDRIYRKKELEELRAWRKKTFRIRAKLAEPDKKKQEL